MQPLAPYLNINVKLISAQNTPSNSKTVLLIGQRITNGTLYFANSGYEQPNYYMPSLLPSFSNGLSALQYLSNFGFQYKLGYTDTLGFSAPDAVVIVNGNTVVSWNVPPPNFNSLAGFNLSGVLTQGSISGTVINATIVSGISQITVQGIVAYLSATDSGAVMSLLATNNIAFPDPNNSDPIMLMVWNFYQAALFANQSTLGSPQAMISVTTDDSSSISPMNTPRVLISPTTVTITGGVTTLNYTFTTSNQSSVLANFGYLNTIASGNYTITQLNSNATGIYNGYTISRNSLGGTVSITVTNVTGVFVNTSGDTISVMADITQNVGQFLNNIDLNSAVLQQPINVLTDITVTHADFYNMINELNLNNGGLNNHFWTYGIAGNITNPASNAQNLPSPNNNEYILTSYPYVQKFGDLPFDNSTGTVGSGRLASTIAYFLANGDAPYPPLTNVSLGNCLPVSSIANSTSYSSTFNGSGNIDLNQGWIAISINTNNTPYILNSITTMITLPNTLIPDTEFKYTHIWDCIKSIKKMATNVFLTNTILPNNQGTALISKNILKTCTAGLISGLFNLENQQVVQNVELYQNLVTVTQDSINVNQIDFFIPSQIIAQVNGASIQINVLSASINNFQSQGV